MALPVVKAVYNAPDYSQDEHLDVCVVLAIFAKKQQFSVALPTP